jgi:carbon starvation protein
MHALNILIPFIGVCIIAYRYYSAFLAAKVLTLNDARVTPAHRMYDGQNYYPVSRWVLFGSHFSAIAGAGPLIGPVLAAQFGYAPGFIWLVAGCCLGGAVHDLILLWASTRRDGRSLAEIARLEIGSAAGITAALAILFIITIALAGLGLAVVNALAESAWGVFTIAATIPIGLFMGFYMFVFRRGRTGEATALGVFMLFMAVVLGKPLAASSMGAWFDLTRQEIIIAMAVYATAASVLPVWLLLAPRGHLSSFMKIGTIVFLAIGVIWVNPVLEAPAFSQFTDGGGPIIPGALFPFVFITIACGAISGFHGLIGTGTTPKMIDKESDVQPIGYGGMLVEGLVGVMALIAATALHPGDYYAINTSPAVFANLNIPAVNLAELSSQVGEEVAGRPGGAVSLAVGMAQIFSAMPGMRGLMDYWYHFAIMFEALFVLTTVDAGTRVGRFIIQEFLGRFYKPLERTDAFWPSFVSTVLIVSAWTYFLWTGSISTLWPLFGIANQLLAGVGLAIGTTMLINMGRARYVWATVLPLAFVTVTTLSAGYLSVRDNFWPLTEDPATRVTGYIDSIATVVMMFCMVLILTLSLKRSLMVITGRASAVPDTLPDPA